MTGRGLAAGIKYPDRFFIDGTWVKPSSDDNIDVIDSSTEDVYINIAGARDADVECAIAAARRAFDHGPWPRMSHHERAAFLREISKRIFDRWPFFADGWSSEMGIMRQLSGILSPVVTGIYDYYASLADSFPFEKCMPTQSGQGAGILVHEPVGVVAAIIPWNAPAILMAQKIAPAFLAGCTVILKAAPEAPSAAYLLAEIAEEVGLPQGVLNVITAEREASELLVRHADVDKVTFTGSAAAGRKIASICGERMARCTLELGGKSAAVIFDDYDIGQAAARLVEATLPMSAQVCAALSRVIVPRARHDEMVDALSAAFAAVKVGDAFDPSVSMGPLALARQRDRVEHYIAEGRAQGATLAAGGSRPAAMNRGFFIEPTVFGNVDNNMIIAREEIFGPVLSVIPVESEAAALDVANDSDFGLNASVFTNDADNAYRAARRLRSGTVGHNGLKGDLTIGFGGFKQSGIGREGGIEGLRPFLEAKTILLDTAPSHLGG